jgi:phosphoglycerate dehydrogenase-like enzyme
VTEVLPNNGRVKILIGSPLEPEQVTRVAAAGGSSVEVLFEPELLPVPRFEGDHQGIPRRLDAEEFARWQSLVADADIMFGFDWLGPSTLRERAPRLRWLQATSAGVGEVLIQSGLAESDIRFTTASGVHASALAEFVALGLLYWCKDVPLLQRRQAQRHWERYTARSLAGQRVLVVGLGEIGRQVARVCSALGMEVWGIRRSAGQARPNGVTRLIPKAELGQALPQIDALVLACPLTRETRRLIGERELAALPASAILINVARGAVVDQQALIDVLARSAIRGAVLDVFEQEPLPAQSPLWGMPNVLISPHSASTVEDENGRIVDIFVDNLRRFLDGRPLNNEFVAERGY